MTLQVVVVGSGSIGKRHASNLIKLGHSVEFLRTSHLKPGESIQNGVRQEIANLGSRKRIDLAIIANPTSLHASAAIEFLRQGIPCLVEKPPATSRFELATLLDAAEQANGLCFVGYQMRFHSGFRALQNFVSKKALVPMQAVVEWSTYLPEWHPGENYLRSYVARPELGGGVTLTCSHEVDMLVQLIGPVSRVFATEPSQRHVIREVDESISAVLKHENGTSSVLSLTLAHQPQRRTFRVLWEDEAVEWNFHLGTLRTFSSKCESSLSDVSESNNDMYVELIVDVLGHLRGTSSSKNLLTSTLSTMNAVYALSDSLSSGNSEIVFGEIVND